MKTNDILLIGGGALVLMLILKKSQAATLPAPAPVAVQTGGKPQGGVVYATPTQTAGVVAGAVNGLLNWISGTPKAPEGGTPGINPGAVLGGIDSAPAGSDSPSLWSLDTWWKNEAEPAASGNVQDGSQLMSWASGELGFA